MVFDVLFTSFSRLDKFKGFIICIEGGKVYRTKICSHDHAILTPFVLGVALGVVLGVLGVALGLL